ncbi:hypothetical protein CYY_010044, partial [Polysphondylium violaceum]
MVIYDQWITPSFNQDWKTIEDEYDQKHFFLNVFLDKSGRVTRKKLEEIPEGTTSIKIVIYFDEGLKDHIDRYHDFDKGYVPSSVTRVKIEYNYSWEFEQCHGSDGWLPDSVTMLTVPSLPFPAALVPKNIRYLKVQNQKKAIEIEMVPPITEYLWIEGLSNTIGPNIVHSIPNTVKELVVDYDVLNKIHIKPTFTSSIHINNPHMYHHGDKFSDNEPNNTLGDLNIQTITSSTPVIARLPTITSFVIEEHRSFNNNLSALHPLPPQLKYLSLPFTYDQPIYQQQHIPISLTHLELSIIIDENNHFTNNWLCRKG